MAEEVEAVRPMSPDEFRLSVALVLSETSDSDALHGALDELMENLLVELGYEDGVELIRSSRLAV